MCSNPRVFQECLVCLPLRQGLMAWGCFKVLVDFIIVMGVFRIMVEAVELSQSEEESFRVVPSIILFFCVIGVVAAVDLIQSILLITGCWKKNVKVLKIVYTYNKYMVCLTTIWAIYYVGVTIYNLDTLDIDDFSPGLLLSELFDILGYFAGAGIQYYIMLLVRSQILALENTCELKYAKKIDPECTLDVKNENYDKTTEKNKEGVNRDNE